MGATEIDRLFAETLYAQGGSEFLEVLWKKYPREIDINAIAEDCYRLLLGIRQATAMLEEGNKSLAHRFMAVAATMANPMYVAQHIVFLVERDKSFGKSPDWAK